MRKGVCVCPTVIPRNLPFNRQLDFPALSKRRFHLGSLWLRTAQVVVPNS